MLVNMNWQVRRYGRVCDDPDRDRSVDPLEKTYIDSPTPLDSYAREEFGRKKIRGSQQNPLLVGVVIRFDCQCSKCPAAAAGAKPRRDNKYNVAADTQKGISTSALLETLQTSQIPLLMEQSFG